MELLKLLSANELVAQIISFLVLLFLMRAFLWKKILGALESRKNRIASQLKSIDDAKAEIVTIKADYQKLLDSINETARKAKQEAIDEGKKASDDIRRKAHLDAQALIDVARKNIEYELAGVMDKLKEKIIDLTISATQDIIEQKLDPEHDRKLVEDFLKKLDKVK